MESFHSTVTLEYCCALDYLGFLPIISHDRYGVRVLFNDSSVMLVETLTNVILCDCRRLQLLRATVLQCNLLPI